MGVIDGVGVHSGRNRRRIEVSIPRGGRTMTVIVSLISMRRQHMAARAELRRDPFCVCHIVLVVIITMLCLVSNSECHSPQVGNVTIDAFILKSRNSMQVAT